MVLGGALGAGFVARDAAAVCVAGAAHGNIHVSRGRCGTNSHPPSFCVTGVALMAWDSALGPDFVARNAAVICVAGMALSDIHLRFTWPAWRKFTSAVVLRGRRGAYGTGWRAWARFCRP